jgi:hypothetical protein
MGNITSTPPPRVVQSIPTPTVSNIETAPVQAAAPVIPVCDATCQREKKLQGLKFALDSATANKVSDPETYQKARIAYYTELEGQGWLDKERERIGQEEVGPEVIKLSDKYRALIEQKGSQSMFLSLIDVLKSEEEQNKQDIKYVYDQTAQNKDNLTTTNRINELGQVDFISTIYPTLLYGLMVIIGIIIVYKLFRFFVPMVTGRVVPVGGKRLPH